MGSAPAHHLGTITMKFLLLLLQSPLCALRPTQLSATPPATTFPTLSGLRSPTPRPRPLSSPTPTLLLSTPPLPDARTAGAVVPCAHGGVVPFGVPVAAAPAAAEEPAVEEARKKREAEAEAEAWIFYRTHGYWPVGYGHLAYSYAPYAYAGHYGYYGLGHHYGYYGRKKGEATAEADAEASPEADP